MQTHIFTNSTINTPKGILIIAALLLFFGCSPAPESAPEAETSSGQSVRISFEPYFHGKAVQCGQTLSMHNEEWQISELAMFLHQFSLNNFYPIILDDNDWQSQQLVLIRSPSDCQQLMSNLSLSGVIDMGDMPEGSEKSSRDLLNEVIKADAGKPLTLSFKVGVPFELNHQNPLLQPSPLNDSSMFWAWRNGYKFIRWDMQSKQGNSWSFHLGSVGCESAAMVRAPKQACAQPNVIPVEVVLPPNTIQAIGFRSSDHPDLNDDQIHISLKLHLDKVINQIIPSQESTCMFSDIDNGSCKGLVNNLYKEGVFE